MAAQPAPPPRGAMYALIAGNQLCNYCVRLALPSLVQVASKELGLSDSAKAMLLSAHTPGYLLTQVPSGMLTQQFGAKRLLTLNTGGAAVLLMLVPVAAGSGPRGEYWQHPTAYSRFACCQLPLTLATPVSRQPWLLRSQRWRSSTAQ